MLRVSEPRARGSCRAHGEGCAGSCCSRRCERRDPDVGGSRRSSHRRQRPKLIELFEESRAVTVNIDTALEAAFQRGDERRAAVLRDASMLTGEEAAARLGVSRETINKRAQQGKLLALEFGKRGKRSPDWQFEDRVARVPDWSRVLLALGSLGAWRRYRFFAQTQPAPFRRFSVDALRDGDAQARFAARPRSGRMASRAAVDRGCCAVRRRTSTGPISC